MKSISRTAYSLGISLVVLFGLASAWATPEKSLAVGDTAPEFSLSGVDEKTVMLSALLKEGPVSLVMLRGFPGYQCPICSKQVGELLDNAKEFAAVKTTVVLVYPGPAKGLNTHAQEFIGSREFPANFRFVVDPDYKLTDAYGLRWDAPRETAYPSTFVIGRDGKITFARISKSHGGRVTAKELLKALHSAK